MPIHKSMIILFLSYNLKFITINDNSYLPLETQPLQNYDLDQQNLVQFSAQIAKLIDNRQFSNVFTYCLEH